MKTIIKILIVPLIIGLLVASYTFYLNRQKVDLRYFLSGEIKTNLSSAVPDIFQQIEVINNGNTKAEKIIIDIDQGIKSFDIIQYSQSDVIQKFQKANSFELIYPELPPQGSFRLIIKFEGKGIGKKDLSIKHNKGLASEALTDTNNTFYTIGIYFILFFFPLVSLLLTIREELIRSFNRKSINVEKVDIVLKKHQPFYISKKAWECIRKDAIDTKANGKRWVLYDEITESLQYELLSLSKPDYISNEEWTYITNKANKILLDDLKSKISNTSLPNEIIKILKIKLPENFDPRYCIDIKEIASRRYISLKINEIFSYTEKRILEELRFNYPEEIDESRRNEYLDSLKKEYFRYLFSELINNSSPLEYLKNKDLNYLEPYYKNLLDSTAYKMQLIELSDFYTSKDAEKFLESERPTWIKDHDYNRLQTNAKNISEYYKLRNELQNEKNKLLNEKNEFSALKQKVLNQLNFINNLLTDPALIDRIEDYENTFAPGNYKNLKKVSEILNIKNNKLRGASVSYTEKG